MTGKKHCMTGEAEGEAGSQLKGCCCSTVLDPPMFLFPYNLIVVVMIFQPLENDGTQNYKLW